MFDLIGINWNESFELLHTFPVFNSVKKSFTMLAITPSPQMGFLQLTKGKGLMLDNIEINLLWSFPQMTNQPVLVSYYSKGFRFLPSNHSGYTGVSKYPTNTSPWMSMSFCPFSLDIRHQMNLSWSCGQVQWFLVVLYQTTLPNDLSRLCGQIAMIPCGP